MASWPYNTQRWQRLRARKLASNPLCARCAEQGIVQAASVVDHVTPISAGGPAFPGLDGLRSYCPPCHNAKTFHVDRRGRARAPIKGCDADGIPLDPDHPWRRGR